MKKLFGILVLGLLATAAHAQAIPSAATCVGATPGTAWGAVWMPCAAVTYAVPTASSVIAIQTGTANRWDVCANVKPNDQIWVGTASPGGPWTKFTAPVCGSGGAATGSFNLSWVAPTQNTDGTPLTDLAGFHIYQSPGTTVYTVAPALTTYTVTGLAPGSYTFASTAFNKSGGESVKSNTVGGTISPVPTCPSAPADVTQVNQCPVGTSGTWTQTHSWVSAAYPTCWSVGPWVPATQPTGACPANPPAVPKTMTVTCVNGVGTLPCSVTLQ